MSTTIDDDFVLTSRRTPFSMRNPTATNSQLTATTRDLTYNHHQRSYSPSRYSGRSPSPTSLTRLNISPESLKQSLTDTIAESRARSRERRYQILNNRLQRSRSPSLRRRRENVSSPREVQSPRSYSSSLDQELDDINFKGRMYRSSSDLAAWSTHPAHLTNSTDPQQLRNAIRMERHRHRSRSPSPRSGKSSARIYESDFPITETESLARTYFPVTMSSYKIEHIPPPMSRSMTTSPPPKHLRAKPESKWRVDGKISISEPLDFSGRHVEEDDISKMYNMAEVAPSIAASTVYMTSPYCSDLASLRLDRLKIEEDHLLEMKRLAEIERLRGPLPKWYELKTPQFHTEARKNNELVKSGEHWKELIDYRVN